VQRLLGSRLLAPANGRVCFPVPLMVLGRGLEAELLL
jgi:hypothetical protein